jgi:L-alanine-DL-glutamate epimerase-like enolase superfamily enzyme
MLRVFDLCEAHGVAVAPHSPYFGPGFVATLHIAAARMEKPLIEVLWLEMEANPFDPWVRAKNGKLSLPQGPGLGCEPDLDVLRRYQVGETMRNEWRAP